MNLFELTPTWGQTPEVHWQTVRLINVTTSNITVTLDKYQEIILYYSYRSG